MLDADGNRNGIIDAPDYNVWRDNFGAIGSGDGTDLVELNPLDALSLTAADGPVSIGNLFDNSALPFAADFTLREDLELEYTSPGVGSIDVTVNYIGERPATTLELIVDPDSGQARLLNPTTSVVDMDAYTILSASGSIDANLATGLGPDWDTAPLSDEFGFTQLNPESSLVLASGEAAELGQLFAAGDADPDLAMTFLTVPGSGLPPGPVDALVVYQSLAGATNAQSLPEPTTLLLAIAAHALLAMVRHRNSS